MVALFTLGNVVITPQAAMVMQHLEINPASLLLRHITGDWGEAGEEQKRANDEAVREAGRILSVYGRGALRLYVMTESDRRTTTIFRQYRDA